MRGRVAGIGVTEGVAYPVTDVASPPSPSSPISEKISVSVVIKESSPDPFKGLAKTSIASSESGPSPSMKSSERPPNVWEQPEPHNSEKLKPPMVKEDEIGPPELFTVNVPDISSCAPLSKGTPEEDEKVTDALLEKVYIVSACAAAIVAPPNMTMLAVRCNNFVFMLP